MQEGTEGKRQYRLPPLRILEIHKALREVTLAREKEGFIPGHKRITKKTLQHRLSEGECSIEVSEKTIQRDIQYMKLDLNCPIGWSQQERSYYYTDPMFEMPAFMVDNSELFALFLAEKMLDQYRNTPIYQNLESIFNKLKTQVSGASEVELLAQQKFTVFPPFSTTIDPDIWDTVVEELKKSRWIEIRYRVPGRKPEWRTIEPYHAVRYEGDWYIIGFCHLRDDIRTFSIARIEDVRILDRKVSLSPGFDFHSLMGSHFGIHWSREGEYRVSIRFDASVADYIRERQWHPSQCLEEQENGDIILSMRVNHLLEVKRWVLSWGKNAQVLEPGELRDDIRDTVLSLTESYGLGTKNGF